MARLDLGPCTVTLNGEEVGMTDGGFLEVKTQLVEATDCDDLSFTLTMDVSCYTHNHGPLGEHRHALLNGEVGPAQRTETPDAKDTQDAR